ncbi:unnamed protein product [Amoebophrya sp. A25]|nr:unnamed protein product [Amoebophrya sp. A25]|eukprot:GSA25T00017169001.1
MRELAPGPLLPEQWFQSGRSVPPSRLDLEHQGTSTSFYTTISNGSTSRRSAARTKSFRRRGLPFFTSSSASSTSSSASPPTTSTKSSSKSTSFVPIDGFMPIIVDLFAAVGRAAFQGKKTLEIFFQNPTKAIASGSNLFPTDAITKTSVKQAAQKVLTPENIAKVIPAVQNPRHWIAHHNHDLDQGMKFMVQSKSGTILWTDLFNTYRFGCFSDNFHQKWWWHHPQLRLGMPLFETKVTLQNDLTGEVKWDAVYNLAGKSFLRHDAEPIGGKHPFFLPDWCPGPAGDNTTAQTWTLTVRNLGVKPFPEVDVVGKMRFIQYPFPLLEANYVHEADIDKDELRTRSFGLMF